jgi:hypothetical protein
MVFCSSCSLTKGDPLRRQNTRKCPWRIDPWVLAPQCDEDRYAYEGIYTDGEEGHKQRDA